MFTASEVIATVKLKLQSTPISEALFTLFSASSIKTRVREALGDNVASYRWTDVTLDALIQMGIDDIKQKRTDASYAWNGSSLSVSELRNDFATAVYFFTLSRAYDDDSGWNDGNLELAATNTKNYYDNLGSVLYFYPETVILDAIDNGIQAILRDRPDARLTDTGLLRDDEVIGVVDDVVDLPMVFKNPLINFSAYESVMAVRTDAKLAGMFLSIYQRETLS